MAKLYPPFIEGTIPAFYGNEIIVPFSMNGAVSLKEIGGFALKIKTVQNNFFLDNKTSCEYQINGNNTWAKFDLSSNNQLKVGQYYKLQLAYISTSKEIGYYSTVGIIKKTCKPQLSIENLIEGKVNQHLNEYIGVYHNPDNTEKEYTYNFTLYDNNNNVYMTSGDILHDVLNDDFDFSFDRWYLGDDLPLNRSFYLEYNVTTLNGAHSSSSQYRIVQRASIAPEIKTTLVANLVRDEGYIQVNLRGITNDLGIEQSITGTFVVCRANIKEPNKWKEITRFVLQGELPSRKLFKDFTIQQGETYIYSLQQYNKQGIYSARITSNKVFADYEDAFLYDGKRQLKIKYNPQISSFKDTIYETKTDTIGGKQPFIFRNGSVQYKEFPISGLISYYMDESNLFMLPEEYNLDLPTIDLINTNINAERRFKLEVLDWLNDGKPKLFKSPTEGLYIVRLLNVSLTPENAVGRMLHSFSCTACEIADLTYENLNKFHLIQVEIEYKDRMRWRTVELMQRDERGQWEYITGEILKDPRLGNESRHIAQTVQFTNMIPGDYVIVNNQPIFIGATGSYTVDIQTPIASIIIPEHQDHGLNVGMQGTVTYSYYDNYENVFDLIKETESFDVPAKQFMGRNLMSYQNKEGYQVKLNQNIVTLLTTVKEEPTQFFVLHFQKRPVETLFFNQKMDSEIPSINGIVDFSQNQFFLDRYKSLLVDDITDLDPYSVYVVNYIDGDSLFKSKYYIDGNNGSIFTEEEYDTKFYYNIGLENDNPEKPINFNEYGGFDLVDCEEYSVQNIGQVHDIYLGSGVMLTTAYLKQVITYNMEQNNETLQNMYAIYENANQKYYEVLHKPLDQIGTTEIEDKRLAAKQAYQDYIDLLSEEIQKYKEARKMLSC